MIKFFAKIILGLCFSISVSANQQILFDFNQEYQKATEQNNAEAQFHFRYYVCQWNPY